MQTYNVLLIFKKIWICPLKSQLLDRFSAFSPMNVQVAEVDSTEIHEYSFMPKPDTAFK